MVVSIPVSPFFEPGSPLPSPPALIAQTDLRYRLIQPTLTAQEDITNSIQLRAATPSRSRILSQTPDPSFSRVRFSAPPSREGSPTTSDSTPSESGFSEDDKGLIPKPPGEAGRPDSGGYNLRRILNWKNFKQLRVSDCGI